VAGNDTLKDRDLRMLATRKNAGTFIFRSALIGTALVFLGIFLVVPLVTVFAHALEKGLTVYFKSFSEPNALAAIRLTLFTAAIVVPLNMVFGLACAWAVAKFNFIGKSILVTLIDLPFAVSPVISGMIYVLLFGLLPDGRGHGLSLDLEVTEGGRCDDCGEDGVAHFRRGVPKG